MTAITERFCIWRLPKPEETEIRAELRQGTIAYGTHVPPGEKTAEPTAA